jgi:hypothetical protein
MTETPSLWCAICERPIRGAIRGDVREGVTGGVLLCPRCAARPVLVQAFREGRARLAEENAA